MMRTLRRLVLPPVMMLAAWSSPAPAQTPTAAAPAAIAQREVVAPEMAAADSLLAAAYPADQPGAAVLVVRDGRVLLRRAYGMADLELGVPARPEHVYRIGSITKQFTAVATLLLADEGGLSLDDDITKFFPDWPTGGRRITVEHLLNHTSGIRSYTGMPEWLPLQRTDLTLEKLIAVFRGQPMDFAPGEGWAYNNSAYILLGAIIEKVSGQAYGEFLRTRFFQPLGMADTRYEVHDDVIPRRVPGYRRTDAGWRNSPYLSMTQPYAAGSLVSTVDDLYRWQRAVAERGLLRPDTWRRAFTAGRTASGLGTGYGYGWFVGQALGRPSIEHGGDIHGFSSNGLWLPEDRLHVIILSNSERGPGRDPDALSRAVAARALGVPEVPTAVAVDAAKLQDYAGVYRVSDTERRVLTVEGGSLYSQRGRSPRQEMRPLGGDRFVFPNTGSMVAFERDAAGRVTAMRLRPRLGPEEAPAPRVDEPAPAPPVAVAVAPEVLDRYVGEYELTPEFVITVRREGAGLMARATGQPELHLVAESETRFAVLEEASVLLEFQRDASGRTTGLILHQAGRQMPARKTR
ncbi:MAG TPA: serine hydrolase [Longimicrobium sp.]|nr:serine hydrolase [Longimicrobium sp.]